MASKPTDRWGGWAITQSPMGDKTVTVGSNNLLAVRVVTPNTKPAEAEALLDIVDFLEDIPT